ncbi:calcium-binding protein [Chthonobacter rhizosphaerae]|uniref:calcium-binding protein n=1 Tax=Chthonobacter rhizosphaerae TaxID=2735553 RepID=UPI0015EEF4B8|nr:calcium-binding protein [Chthonobacter rhizosphaerae]
MSTLAFDLSQTSVDPGWAPQSGLAHDFYWRNFLTGYEYTTEAAPGVTQTGSSGVFSSAEGDAAIRSATFETNTIPGWGGPAVSIDWTGDDVASITQNRDWNVIKNIRIDSFDGAQLTVSNFVDVWLTLNETTDQSITLDDVKRAEVKLGSGDDMVKVNVATNGDIWTNHFKINTGAGDDTITIGDDVDVKVIDPASFQWTWISTNLNAGAGDDIVVAGNGRNTIFGGDGNDTIVSGASDDKIDGGDGADQIWGGAGNDWISAGSDTEFVVNEIWGGTGKDTLVGSAAGVTHFHLDDIGRGDVVTGGALGQDTLSVGEEAKYNVGAATGGIRVNGAVVSSVSELYIDTGAATKVNVYGNFAKSGLERVVVNSDGMHHINAGGAGGVVLEVDADGGHGIIHGSKSHDIFRISDINSDDSINGNKGIDSLTLRTAGTDVQTIAMEGTGGGALSVNGGFVQNVEKLFIEGSEGGDRIILSGEIAQELVYEATGSAGSVFFAEDVTSTTGLKAIGAAGNDILVGAGGADTLAGAGGGDIVIGGAGNDLLHGSGLDDPLADDGISDLFVFETGSGHDQVFGFGVGDLLDITDYGFTYDDLVTGGRLVAGAGFVDVVLGADDSIRVHVASLEANDFLTV